MSLKKAHTEMYRRTRESGVSSNGAGLEHGHIQHRPSVLMGPIISFSGRVSITYINVYLRHKECASWGCTKHRTSAVWPTFLGSNMETWERDWPTLNGG